MSEWHINPRNKVWKVPSHVPRCLHETSHDRRAIGAFSDGWTGIYTAWGSLLFDSWQRRSRNGLERDQMMIAGDMWRVILQDARSHQLTIKIDDDPDQTRLFDPDLVG